ncbi:bactofilin family protein [Roseospirillum parvum]|uniref:Protein CcmA, bactofilin family n=1 Tax=Roseospirillum parvum TaxID=83401 RepID=A0A1G7YH19_9PROT|nr:polymer-forming cytoskeletal protein [Roseospirillum parvum]SDG95170.1 protein CcmA, bactofilin family [Roseospirillum parvum]
MFSKGGSKSAGRQLPEANRSETATGKSVPSLLGTDLKVVGDLECAGEIQIDGQVEGDIRCGTLVVGVKGRVTGEVTAKTVRLHGTIHGLVSAQTVFLASTAQMKGDIRHESLAIEPGAHMEGHCRRVDPSEAPSHAPRSAANQVPAANQAGATPANPAANSADAARVEGGNPARKLLKAARGAEPGNASATG